MRNIIACLCKSSVVQTVDVIEIIDEPEIQLLYVRVTLTNQTLLYIARPKSFATILLDILSIFDIVEVCKQQNIHIQLLKFENEL